MVYITYDYISMKITQNFNNTKIRFDLKKWSIQNNSIERGENQIKL